MTWICTCFVRFTSVFTSSGIRIELVTHYTCLYGDVTIMLLNLTDFEMMQ